MNAVGSSAPRDRFSQFSLRQFALLLAVLAVLLAIWAPRFQHVQREKRLALVNEQLLSDAAAGDLDGVAKAISDGAQVGARDVDGRSALDYATEKSNTSLVQLLLSAGAGRDAYATTALAAAIRENEVALARRLLEAGIDPNSKGMPYNLSPLHFCADRGAFEMMELLIEFGADVEKVAPLPTPILVDKGTPLLAAICCGESDELRLQMVRHLLEGGADPNADSGRNAMDLAVHDADGALGDLLRKYGAAYGPREAVAFGRLGEVKTMVEENPGILAQRYRPTYAARPGQGPTLLGIALRNGDRPMSRFLIDQGAPLDVVEGLGGTLLHLAARGGNAELVRMLVARGLDANARDEYNDTPLTDCVATAPIEVVSALIDAGADINARRSDGRTALHLATSRNRTDVVERLLAAGADPNLVGARDDNGDGP